MTKNLLAIVAVALLAGPMAANAIPFTITAAQFTPGSGYGQDFDEHSGGAHLLDVRFSTSAFSAQNFELSAVNQSFTFNFGTIDMEEPNGFGGIVGPDEMDDLGISANLTFTAPTGVIQTATALGFATPGSVSDSQVDYVIDWSPVTILFGNGGSFRLSLTDMAFDRQGSQFQTATITLLNLGDQVAPINVPEPGTLALFGLGLAGLGLARRRRATN